MDLTPKLFSGMSQDMVRMLDTGVLADVKFVVGLEKTEMMAHSFILNVRSSMLAAIFRKEKEDGSKECLVVEIPDIESKTMKILLKYIYGGVVDDEWAYVAENFMYAVKKFELPVVGGYIDENIGKALTPANAFKILKHVNSLEAVRTIKEYIDEHLKEVLKYDIE